jgi:hypothetical protein
MSLCLAHCNREGEECLDRCEQLFQATFVPFMFQMAEMGGYVKDI